MVYDLVNHFPMDLFRSPKHLENLPFRNFDEYPSLARSGFWRKKLEQKVAHTGCLDPPVVGTLRPRLAHPHPSTFAATVARNLGTMVPIPDCERVARPLAKVDPRVSAKPGNYAGELKGKSVDDILRETG